MKHTAADRIPSYDECIDLIEKHGMLENIREHSILVMKVARAIALHIRPETPIHVELVVAGALLHDITKTQSLVTHEHHDKTGETLLCSIGMFSVGKIVGEHVEIPDFDAEGPLRESEIVHYADKRVKHSTVVSLADRINDLIVRYATNDEHKVRIMDKVPFNEKLERKISQNLDGDIDDIIRGVQ
jgi:putative nucleotidyltransferase with HDIG domain